MTKEQAKIIYKDIINQFGYINNPASVDAVYILRDGNFLDTCGGYPNHQHINVAKYISQKYNINDIQKFEYAKLWYYYEKEKLAVTFFSINDNIL